MQHTMQRNYYNSYLKIHIPLPGPSVQKSRPKDLQKLSKPELDIG